MVAIVSTLKKNASPKAPGCALLIDPRLQQIERREDDVHRQVKPQVEGKKSRPADRQRLVIEVAEPASPEAEREDLIRGTAGNQMKQVRGAAVGRLAAERRCLLSAAGSRSRLGVGLHLVRKNYLTSSAGVQGNLSFFRGSDGCRSANRTAVSQVIVAPIRLGQRLDAIPRGAH
jgi:hypothetical protein